MVIMVVYFGEKFLVVIQSYILPIVCLCQMRLTRLEVSIGAISLMGRVTGRPVLAK